MARKFTIKEIAHQAGLGPATVDRALHGRGHVREATRERVRAAVDELERQHAASRLRGTRVTLDIVMQAPSRFTSSVRAAFEAELPLVRPATFRARFHMAEIMTPRDIAARLRAIARRGTHGVVLKVPATPEIESALALLAVRGIPVVTYVTDMPAPLRLAYVGMPNARAGATTAYLLRRMAAPGASRVLVTLSSESFEGEAARLAGFAAHLSRHAPHLACVRVSEGFGVDRPTGEIIRRALAEHPDISCVYSIGGGNRAILDAFARAGHAIDVFAAHDLDRTNTALLREGRLSFVIHHGFRQDARCVALHVARHYRLVDPDTEIEETEINIACPVSFS